MADANFCPFCGMPLPQQTLYEANHQVTIMYLATDAVPLPVPALRKVEVQATRLNIRETPTTKAKIVGSLGLKAVVTILEEEGGWGKVEVAQVKGWIDLGYTRPV